MYGEDRYGYYRYGRSAPSFPDRITPRRGPDVDTGPTPEEALGTGIALKPTVAPGISWDFEIASDGDLGITRGYDEFGKDVAFYTAWEGYDELVGQLRTIEKLGTLEETIRSIASQDDRVETIEAVRVEKHDDDPDRVNVYVELDPDSEHYNEFVFPLTVDR
jgi:hypothetical protein